MSQSTEFRYETGPSGESVKSAAESVRIEHQDTDRVYSVTVGGQSYEVRVNEITPDTIRFSVEGRSRRAFVVTDDGTNGSKSRRLVALDGIDGRVYTLTPVDARESRRKTSTRVADEGLTAAMPGQVVKVLVSQGEAVTRGQALVVIEAMKMELRVTAPHDGQVARVLIESGQVVERGQPLVMLERSGS